MAEVTKVLDGTTAVVTGGGRGLGRAMSVALANAGATTVAVDIDQEPLDELVAATRGRVAPYRADVSSQDEISALVDQCLARYGHLDVVINNAGINLETLGPSDSPNSPAPFYELGPLAIRRFYEVHVLAPFLLARAAVGGMIEQGFGRIITVTTSFRTMVRNAPYGPMKAASEAFAATMASDLRGTPVTVNVLIPGGAADTRLATRGGQRPLIDPTVMGPPAVWLASSASQSVTAMRFLANRWDTDLPDDEAARRAAEPIAFHDLPDVGGVPHDAWPGRARGDRTIPTDIGRLGRQ